MKRLFFTNPDSDYLCEVIPSEKFTIDDMKVGKDIPEGVTSEKIEHDTLPSPILREAWKLNASDVDIDMVKGKEVCHRIRREKREAFMADNLEIIQKYAAGIPLAPDENATSAKTQNADYKANIDDPCQANIDGSTSEAELLACLDMLP